MELSDEVLVQLVTQELLALRGSPGPITPSALSDYGVISGLFPGFEPVEVFGEVETVIRLCLHDEDGNTRAAAMTLMADADNALGKLDQVGAELQHDQRHVRRLSNDGMPRVARHVLSAARLRKIDLHLINLAGRDNKPTLHIRTRAHAGNIVEPIVSLDGVSLRLKTVEKMETETHQSTEVRLTGDVHTLEVRWDNPFVPVIQFVQEAHLLDYWVSCSTYRSIAILKFEKRPN